MKNFCIELDTRSNSYFSGEVIKGRVIIECEKPKEVKEITLLLEGIGRVQWSLTETFTGTDSKSATSPSTGLATYSEKEKYVSQKLTLAGDNYNPMTLPVGTTSYPFEFVLPCNCPSSFSTKFGHVAYFLEAEIHRHILKRNRKCTKSFTVNGNLDLDCEPAANQPQQMQKTKGSNLLACRSGQLGFCLRLPKSAYVPGEILDFSGEITNNSNRKISEVKASFQQVVQCQAKLISKVERIDICTVSGPEVHTGDHLEWKPETIHIPPLPPTGLGGMCKIIDVQYYLRFEAEISGCSKALFGEVPVMIGSTNLRSTSEGIRDQSEISTSSSGTTIKTV